MKFLIRQKAFINLPMHLENDPPSVIRLVPQLINAEPSSPREIDLPDDISLDSISSSWEPLDERAKGALARLAAHRAEIRRHVPAPAAEHAAPLKPEPAKLTPADAVDLIASMPEEQRQAILASITEKDRAAKEAAKAGDTMSGKSGQQHPKGKA